MNFPLEKRLQIDYRKYSFILFFVVIGMVLNISTFDFQTFSFNFAAKFQELFEHDVKFEVNISHKNPF